MTNPMTTKELAALAEALEGCEERIDADGSVWLNLLQVDAEKAAETILALTARLDRYEVGLLSKLRTIRAKTGNLLFDAGTWDACEKIEAFIALNAKDVK